MQDVQEIANRPVFQEQPVPLLRLPVNHIHGKEAYDTPRLAARRFEEMVVRKIRANVLTDSNIRALVKVVDEQMDGVAGEQRKRLESIQSEPTDVRRKLDRLYDLVETTDMDINDFRPRIRATTGSGRSALRRRRQR